MCGGFAGFEGSGVLNALKERAGDGRGSLVGCGWLGEGGCCDGHLWYGVYW